MPATAEHPHTSLPPALYIGTYDICGYDQATGREKEARRTGIVTHTHQLIDGLRELSPSIEITVSQTATPEGRTYELTTPEGRTVFVTSLHPGHPVFQDPAVRQAPGTYDPANPIHTAYAEHYATSIWRAGAPYVLSQNPFPLIGMLKAEELGYLRPMPSGQLRLTTVVHDSVDYPRRFDYVRARLKKTRLDIAFVAISQSVRGYMIGQGIPEELVTLVPNGMNAKRFDERVRRAKELGTFARVQARDGLPLGKKLILCTAGRVRIKGHHVIIEAAKLLREQGKLADAYIAFAGKSMTPAQSIDRYTEELETSMREKGLANDIFFLDAVSPDELAACYGEAYLTLSPSIHPEGLPYVNFEAMLAGAPVIASRSGGPLDYVVHGENGLFVEPNDPIGLAHAIGRVLASPRLHAKLVRHGRKTAEEYSAERMAQGYARVIARE
jgi:glycosyltransferase involved in cell wall biosynthesis